MNEDVKSDKERLRKRYRLERHDGFMPVEFTNLLEIAEIKAARVIASYVSFGDEPVTDLLNQSLLNAGKTLLLPCISGSEMTLVQWNGEASKLNTKTRIPEPIGEPFNNLAAVDVVIVPALRMDSEGYRLGQGGGYYDRALGQISGWKIALVHSGELTSEKLPRESHDQPVNAAATPDLLVRFR